MIETWLECDFQKGMFSNERVVALKDSDDELNYFVVPIESVKEESGKKYVKVSACNVNGFNYVVLHNETKENIFMQGYDE